MKVTLVMVVSVDGKTTRGDENNVYGWSSPEDRLHFQNLKSKNQVIIMGRKTYDVVKEKLEITSSILRLVVTKQPVEFITSTVEGQLEFTSDTPNVIVNNLDKRGYQNVLLVGGHELNAGFLRAKLINELVLTVEPVLFGEGFNLVANKLNGIELQLINIHQLNQRGTLVCRYKII